MSPHVQPRAIGRSVPALVTTLVAAIATGGAAIPVAVPSSGETIELQANLFGVGADYFEQDMHQFRCHVTPTNISLEPFFTACSRQQAHDFSGDTPVMLTMRANSASEVDNIDIQLAAAQAELNIAVPPTMLTKAVGGGDRRQRRVVPDGDRTQLVVRIQYNDAGPSYCDEACARAMINSPSGGPDVDTLYRATSYGRIRFPAAQTRVITVRVNANVASKTGCPFMAMSTEADALATQQHSGLRLDDYTHKSYLIPSNTPGCGWGGVAYVNTCANGPHAYCKAWIRVNSGGVLAHELGHNLGTIHAADDPEDDGTQNLEYGDYGCVMGGADWVSMNAPHRELMNWIGASNGVSTCTTGSSSTVTIARLDLPPGSQGHPTMIKIPRSGGGNYLLSFKSPSDWDGSAVRSSYRNSIQIHNHDGSLANTKFITAITAGASFSGRGGLSVTVVSVDGDSATVRLNGANCPNAGTRNPTRSGATNPPTPPPSPPPNGGSNPNRGAISCGSSVTGTTVGSQNVVGNAAGDAYYTFTLSQAKLIEFDACDSSYDTWVRIMDSSLSQELSGCDDCGGCSERTRTRLTHTLQPGSYTVVIEGWEASEGVFSMVMSCTNAEPPTRPPTRPPTTRPPTRPPASNPPPPTTRAPTTDSGSVHGSIVCGQRVFGTTVGASNTGGNLAGDHVYQLDLAQEQLLEFDACDSAYDSSIRIFDQDQNQELVGCDNCGGCSVQGRTRLATTLSAGSYRIMIEGSGRQEGVYSMGLTCPDTCSDNHFLCGLWARIGYCVNEAHNGYMRDNCPSSCALCPGFEHNPPPEDGSGPRPTPTPTPPPTPPPTSPEAQCPAGYNRNPTRFPNSMVYYGTQTLSACADGCSRNAQCTGFVHRASDNRCHAFRGSTSANVGRCDTELCCDLLTSPPSTPPPSSSECHQVACGRGDDPSRPCNEDGYCATLTEMHEVRCCSDTVITGWRHRTDCPWTESNNFSPTATECIHGMTFGQADAFCTSVGARLCTADEVSRQCTRATGCGHDNDLIWTSNVGTWNPADAGLALAAEASGSNTWDTPTTTTEAPEDGTEQPQPSTAAFGPGNDGDMLLSAASSGTDTNGDDLNAGVITGVIVGILLVVVIVLGAIVYYRHRRREGGNRGESADTGVKKRPMAQNLAHDATLVTESETDGVDNGHITAAERQKAVNRNSMC